MTLTGPDIRCLDPLSHAVRMHQCLPHALMVFPVLDAPNFKKNSIRVVMCVLSHVLTHLYASRSCLCVYIHAHHSHGIMPCQLESFQKSRLLRSIIKRFVTQNLVEIASVSAVQTCSIEPVIHHVNMRGYVCEHLSIFDRNILEFV